ncbi:MAG TPA: sulfatase-like hydrolase/transferase [Verrucomicrobiales bacterium]|nr:sulfatase-like hydrolase/transferase [Verrucomicrobiales bacterium]
MYFRCLPFCVLFAIFSLSFPVAAGAVESGPKPGELINKRPNIILVMSDDQGWGDIGYNGHPVLKTPNLDAAAASGLKFDRFYAAAPSCSPTRASVLTGRHPNRMGVFSWGMPIRPQETTLAEVLKREGYVTGHFGKWHLGSVRADSPVNPGANGFDRWVSASNFYDLNPELSDQGRDIKLKGEGSVATVDVALDWIREKALGEAPIFAVIWFGSPHFPHHAAPEDAALYADQPKKHREYLGEITGVDRAFGLLRNELTALGIKDNTLVWFNSDNGAMPVGDSGDARGGKHAVYEGGLRVPAFIEWPQGIPVPMVSPVRCCTTDIFPTILEVAGVSETGHRPLDGISLVPLIHGEMALRPIPLGFWNAGIPGTFTNPAGVANKVLPKNEEWSAGKVERVTRRVEKIPKQKFPDAVYSGHSAWISGDWKLHRISSSDGEKVKWSLYNLTNDPQENKDVAKAYPEIVVDLKVGMEAWLESVVQSLRGRDY